MLEDAGTEMSLKEVDSGEITFLLEAEGKELRADRREISAASDYLCALLNSQTKETGEEGIIRLEHISESIMKAVLEFICSGNVQVTHTNALDLIEAADYLHLPSLKTIAAIFVEQEIESLSNCIATYYFANRYQLRDLEANLRKFIFLNFTTIAASQEFLDLESRRVEEWIRGDDIAVTREEEVFTIIVRWAAQNESERKKYFEELFRHVRLAFISRDNLYDEIATNDLVLNNSSCLRLVEEAMDGVYSPTPRRRDTHIVVSTIEETLYYQPNEEKWYRMPREAAFLSTGEFHLLPAFQGKLYAFPIFASPLVPAGHIYDPLSNLWTELDLENAPVWQQALKSAVTVVNEDIYSVSIRTLNPDSSFFISKYNAESNSWSNVCSRPNEIILDGSRVCSVALGRYLYVLGGNYLHKPQKSAARFDTVECKWESIADMTIARSNACGIAAEGKIFIAGGCSLSQENVAEKSGTALTGTCEMYTPEYDEWQLIASLNTPRERSSMVYLAGALYVLGGVQEIDGSTSPSLAVESYDLQEQIWKIETILPINERSNSSVRKQAVGVCTLNISKRVLQRHCPKLTQDL